MEAIILIQTGGSGSLFERRNVRCLMEDIL